MAKNQVENDVIEETVEITTQTDSVKFPKPKKRNTPKRKCSRVHSPLRGGCKK